MSRPGASASRPPLRLDASESSANTPIVRLRDSQRELAKDFLRKALDTKTDQELLEALEAVAGLHAGLVWTARTTPTLGPVRDPLSGLNLPIPSPRVPYTSCFPGRKPLENIPLFVAHIYGPWLDAEILLLEDVHTADFTLWRAIRSQAQYGKRPLHECAFDFGILSQRIIDSEPKRYARQSILLKALLLRNEAQSRLMSSQKLVASLSEPDQGAAAPSQADSPDEVDLCRD